MKINIQFETKTFDPEKFKSMMNVVTQYAQNKKDLQVYASDTTFICGVPEEVMQPEKIKGVKEIAAGLTKDLGDVDEALTPAEQEMIRDVTGSHPEQPAEPPCDCHDHDKAVASKGVGKCKNCDQEFSLKKKSDKFCSPECRKEYFNHGNKSRAERAAAEEHPEELVCPVCGEKFSKHYPKQKCCSDDCQKLYTAWNIANKRKPIALKDFIEARDAKKAEKKRISELKQRKCAYEHCDNMFIPSTEDQKYCSRACKEAVHKQRVASKLVDVPAVPQGRYKHICEVCEQPFSDDKLVSKFCPKCLGQFGLQECFGLAEDTKARKLAQTVVRPGQRQYKVCPKCGHNFDTIDPNQFFCDKCTARALKQPKVKPLKPLEPEPIPPTAD